jgi:hypothetical protein
MVKTWPRLDGSSVVLTVVLNVLRAPPPRLQTMLLEAEPDTIEAEHYTNEAVHYTNKAEHYTNEAET